MQGYTIKTQAKRKRSYTHHERPIQISIVKMLDDYGNIGIEYWHTPNGGGRNLREAQQLKAMGTKPGVPDLTILSNGKSYFIEVKKDEHEKLSKNQEIRIARIKKAGGIVSVVHNKQMAKDFLIEHNIINDDAIL